MDPAIHPARRLWQHVETIHAVTYFAPEVADALAAAGLRGWWRGYFAARSAPLGAAGPGLVQALFHGFAPALVQRCLPSAWDQIAPEAAMAARDRAVEQVLGRLLDDAGLDLDVALVTLARQATTGCTLPGRGLYAAHAARPWPASSPPLDLWWACTLLREHRGDGHVAALTASGVGGCEANQLAVLDGAVPAERQQEVRGWSDEEWAAAGERARARPPGFRAGIEARTDDLAAGPVEALGPGGLDELLAGLGPVVAAVLGTGLIPDPNPVGVPRPA
jgi:hypothetical protein